MKLLARITSLIVLVATVVFYSGCGGGGGEAESEKDVQLGKLNGTWNATSVTLENADPGVDYGDFVLSINAPKGSTSFTYTTSGRPDLSPWPGNGNFTFGTSVSTQLIRSDDVQITYSVSATTLTMDFDFQDEGYAGRVNNVTGDWHFEFTKQ